MQTVGEAVAAREEEERGNAMRALENRTLDSKKEMDIMDALEELIVSLPLFCPCAPLPAPRSGCASAVTPRSPAQHGHGHMLSGAPLAYGTLLASQTWCRVAPGAQRL